MKAALFPGSFDPFTCGHYDIARRALTMFDKLYIAVGVNPGKKSFITPSERVQLIKDCFGAESNVEVLSYSNLTVALCKHLGVNVLVHGVRSFADFEYERQIAEVNNQIDPSIENVFLLATPGFASVSSSAVRELMLHGADVNPFMPQSIDVKKYL